jgi:hypothetical protein
VTDIATRPLSLLAQFVTDEGPALTVGDNLGFAIEFWQIGDVIVQKHILPIPDTATQYEELTLITGGYWLDTMERWPTYHDDNVIILERIRVK